MSAYALAGAAITAADREIMRHATKARRPKMRGRSGQGLLCGIPNNIHCARDIDQDSEGVYAYLQGMYFSVHDVGNATSFSWLGEPNPLPSKPPLFLVPNGPPGHKPNAQAFTPE